MKVRLILIISLCTLIAGCKTKYFPRLQGKEKFHLLFLKKKISFGKGVSTAGRYEIVVTETGEIIIGRGHYKMSGEATRVLGAGTITIDSKGVISFFTNSSGHYKSGAVGLSNLKMALLDAGLITKKTPSLDVSLPK